MSLEVEPKSAGIRILCFDGGDSRCMSQLQMIKEFMYRAQETSRKKLLPCDFFDLIVGVDASGPLAAFLGLLRMSVEDAEDAFFKLYTTVYPDRKCTPEQRAILLKEGIADILSSEKVNIPDTTKLSDDVFKRSCKVALCYVPTARADSCKMFRNYRPPHRVTEDVTILEALCATWATPELNSPFLVGPEGRREKVMSAMNGFNNPTEEAIREAYHVFGSQRRISCLLSLGSGQRGVIALNQTGKGQRQLSAQMTVDCEAVAEDVYRRIGRLQVYYRFSVDYGLEGWGSCGQEFGSIKSHTEAYLSKEATSTQLDQCLVSSRKTGNVTLDRLYRLRMQGRGSSHGLPPLSAFFVMRRKPMEALVNGLLDDNETMQRVMVLSGLGGSGKTQLALKFAIDYERSFEHILFVDASSQESLTKGLIARVHSINPEHTPKSVEEALELLAHPDDLVTRNWFLILDNADDTAVKISQFIPLCRHGSVLITTRNSLLGDMAPNNHLKLDVMDPEEAMCALLSSIYPESANKENQDEFFPSIGDRQVALTIIEELGYLPIAIIQAGCYIRQQHCLHDYLNRLKSNRAKILLHPTPGHREWLKYEHSVYASFDTTLEILSIRARRLLGILSFGHFSNFPLPLFSAAASTGFLWDPFDLLERSSEFQSLVQFLKSIFCPKGDWQEDGLDDILEELQRYSIVTMVPVYSIVTLRFHPLVHKWARDRMTLREQALHRAAAVRLLTCGIGWDNVYLFDHISSHITALSDGYDIPHINDRACLAQLAYNERKLDLYLQTWQKIHRDVEAVHGPMHVRTSRAMLTLADAYGGVGELAQMERLVREVISIREALLGPENLETINARANLARTFRIRGDFVEAERVEKDILRLTISTLGIWHQRAANAMVDLATTFFRMKRYYDAQALLSGAANIRTKLFGRNSIRVGPVLEGLAQCYSRQGDHEKAEELLRQVLELRKLSHGEQHVNTVNAMSWLAQQYHEQKRHREAEILRRKEVNTRRRVQGEYHSQTLDAVSWLARACFEQERYEEAESLWEQVMEGQLKIHGKRHMDTLDAMLGVARARFQQEKYSEAEASWKAALEGYRVIRGNDHNCTLEALFGLAHTFFRQNKYEDAAELWKQVVGNQQALHGERNAWIFTSMGWLARTRLEQGLGKEAERLWVKTLEGLKKAYGENHGDTLDAFFGLARTYYRLDRYGEAEHLLVQVVEKQRSLRGIQHGNTLETMNWLASTRFHQARYAEAEDMWKKELEARMEQGNAHPSARVAGQLARLYLLTGRYEQAKGAAEEAIRFQRESSKSNDQAFSDAIRLLESIQSAMNTAGETDDAITNDRVRVEDDLHAPDPGGDPGFSLQYYGPPTPLSPVTPPFTTFTMRPLFGVRPNHWSMF